MENKVYKSYKAIRANGSSIVTVLATSHEEARETVRKELNKNPSRQAFLAAWKKDGELIKER